MKFTELELRGAFLIELDIKKDERGWFSRIFCRNEFSEIGHTKEWVQINHSTSKYCGTIRGLHFQKSPCEEIKLVRCISGKIFDVIVDFRANSETYLKWVSVELSADNKKMLYIPEGFAHGFQTLSDNVEIIYHHTEFYSPENEGGVRYNDPVLKINWPLPLSYISDRDLSQILINSNTL
jgi:dTDP-4-dehydrorhamnose 3,5-epimerase